MIPLHKLEKLPRPLRLRKIGKILEAAERQIAFTGRLESPGLDYFRGLLDLLTGDKEFSLPDKESLKKSGAMLCGPGTSLAEELQRALNPVRHVILAETGYSPADWDLIDPAGRLDGNQRRPFPGVQVYLEDIRSPFNIGALFRTAESFGVERLYLSPLCADPRHPRALRTAMGCVDLLPWERLQTDPFDPGPGLPEGPFFALETGGIPVDEFPFPQRGAMILGSEELGVSPRALAAGDASLGRVSIPTIGVKGSINVSVAFGIAMQRWAATLGGPRRAAQPSPAE